MEVSCSIFLLIIIKIENLKFHFVLKCFYIVFLYIPHPYHLLKAIPERRKKRRTESTADKNNNNKKK